MKRFTLTEVRQEGDLLYLSARPKKPRNNIIFEAGQYVTIAFKGDNGRLSPARCFSLTSSPASPDTIELAMRIEGPFTQAASRLQAGEELLVQGPFGDFVIEEEYDKNIVLMAAGIGITPFMSMLRQATATKSPINITLLFGSRSGTNIPFHKEIQRLEASNPKLKVFYFISGSEVVANQPRVINAQIKASYVDRILGNKYSGRTFFICGPKSFAEDMASSLRRHSVSEDRIVTESFTQSSKLTLANGLSVQNTTYVLAAALLVMGIASIAFLDLSRYVPKHASAQPITQQTIVQPAANGDSTSNASNTNQSPTTTTTTPVPAQTNYRSPTTSVS